MVELYGSLSANPSNFGFTVHNVSFAFHNLEKFYCPFKVFSDQLSTAVRGLAAAGVKGMGIGAPHKIAIIDLLDESDDLVQKTGSCNTVLNDDGKLIGYNTDYFAVNKLLTTVNIPKLIILGNGGYSRTVQCVCKDLKIDFTVIERKDFDSWANIPHDQYIFNATPVLIPNDNVINASIDTPTGKTLGVWQASEQFRLYSNGLEFPEAQVKLELGLI